MDPTGKTRILFEIYAPPGDVRLIIPPYCIGLFWKFEINSIKYKIAACSDAENAEKCKIYVSETEIVYKTIN